MLLQNLFLDSVRQFADRTAVIDRTSGKTYSYAQLGAAAYSLSRAITSNSSYVGICIPTSAGCTIAIAAVLLAEKIPVMINYATGAVNNSLYAQKKCGFSTIITSRGLLQKLELAPIDGMVFLEDLMGSLQTVPVSYEQFSGSDDDTALILFTSGSEKTPKCVQLTHRNIASNAFAVRDHLRITADDVFASILPFYHSFGYTVNLWLPLASGAAAATHASPLEYASIVETIRVCKATVLMGTSSFYRGYLKKASDGDFASLRIAVAGAEKLRAEIREEYREKHGVAILEGYGCTETSPVVCVNQPWNNTPGSIGTCIPGVSVKIADPDTGAAIGRNREGLIMVSGDNIMKGYLDDPVSDAAALIDGWYNTGDMGILDDDGRLWHRGRLRRFVKIAGEMVSLVAVEDVLDAVLPEGVQLCMAAVPDPEKGARLIAAHTGTLDEEAIRSHIASALGNLMVPSLFHHLKEMPVMGTGKVDFKSVEALCGELYGR